MFNFIYNFIFLLTSVFILIKTINYGIYEIKCEKNKPGGYSVIALSTLVVFFDNLIIWNR